MNKTAFALLAGLVLSPGGVWATLIGAASTPDGAYFAQACAGNGIGSVPQPGVAMSNYYGGTMTCQGTNGAPGVGVSGSAARSGTVNGFTYSNNATASAGGGVMRVRPFNDGSTATAFPAGTAQAGYNDRVTITGGSGLSYWVLPFHIEGMLSSPDFTGVGSFDFMAYQNGNPLQVYSGPNGAVAYNVFDSLNAQKNFGAASGNAGTQAFSYKVQNYGVGSPLTYAVLPANQTVYMVIPFTFGASFNYGLWAMAVARVISSGGFLGQTTTTIDFGNTIYYAGGAYAITPGNSIITNLSYTSAAGIDYQNAATPEPGTWLTGFSALVAAVSVARRRAVR